jgi:hypothetical protein
MDVVGDVGHLKFRIGPFGGSVSVRARSVHGFHQTYHVLSNRFGRTRWYSNVMRL